MKNTLKSFTAIIALFLFAFTISGCDKEDLEAYGEFEVYMTDGPGAYESLDIEIEKIEAYHESDGWVTLNAEAQVFDVLTLTNGREEKVAKADRSNSGTYTKARISFGANNKLTVDVLGVSTEFALSAQSQIEIEINTVINEGENTKLLLDFHVGESIVGSASAGFSMEPVITVIADEKTGVSGSIENSQRVFLTLEGNGKTYDGYSDGSGNFLVRGVAEGSYDMTIEPEDTDNYPSSVTVENVTVVNGQITNTGTIDLN